MGTWAVALHSASLPSDVCIRKTSDVLDLSSRATDRITLRRHGWVRKGSVPIQSSQEWGRREMTVTRICGYYLYGWLWGQKKGHQHRALSNRTEITENTQTHLRN